MVSTAGPNILNDPDDMRQSGKSAKHISDLAFSLAMAVNDRYKASQATIEVRVAERTRTLKAFQDQLSQLEGDDTVGGFESKVDAMTSQVETELERVRAETPAGGICSEMSEGTTWSKSFGLLKAKEKKMGGQ